MEAKTLRELKKTLTDDNCTFSTFAMAYVSVDENGSAFVKKSATKNILNLRVLNSSAGTYDTGQSLLDTCYTNVKFTKHVHTKDCPKGSRYCPGTASVHFEEPDGDCPGGGFDRETGESCVCGHCLGWYQCTGCGHYSHKGSACSECAKIEAGYTCDKRLNAGGVTVLGCGKTERVRYADEGVEYYQKNCGHYNGEILNIEVTYTKEESHG